MKKNLKIWSISAVGSLSLLLLHLLWFLASHLRELAFNESSAVQSNRFAKLIDVSKTEFFTKLIDMRKTELALVKSQRVV